MRFESIKARNMGALKSVDIDIASLPGQLVALVGANGAGKTTLLELLAGSLYRDCPTRGSLMELASARDSFVEVRAVNGKSYTIRHLVDGVGKKASEALVLGDAGPVYETTKVTAFDRWSKAHITPSDILYSSSFAVQGRRGFLDMKEGDRKELLIDVLRLKLLEQLAEDARKFAGAERGSLESLRARLGDIALPDLAALELRAADAALAVSQAEERVRGARVALERAKAAAADSARLAEIVEQRAAAQRRLVAAEAQLADIQERIANNQRLLARGDEIRAAQARAAEFEIQIANQHTDHHKADLLSMEAVRAAHAAAAEVSRVARAIGLADEQIGRLVARLKDRAAVEGASERLVQLAARQAEVEAEQQVAEQRAETLQHLVLSGKDERIVGLRIGLEGIANADEQAEGGDVPAAPWARNVLASDDDLAAKTAKAPQDLQVARGIVASTRDILRAVAEETRRVQALASRRSEMEQSQADRERADAERASLSEQLAAATSARDAADAARTAARAAEEVAGDALTKLRRERESLTPMLQYASNLEQAQARVDAYTSQIAPLEASITQARADLATLPAVEADKAVDLVHFEREVTLSEHAERAARSASTEVELAIKSGRETLQKRAALENEIAAADEELADWVRLGQDLGRDGLQCLEIDSALPEWSTITNELLASCFGTRFTVELRTDRLSADGKKSIEDLEVVVIDAQNGRDAKATSYSGGEVVLVGSALSLALTTLACRRAGVERPTICLDEAGAALDAANGRAWIAMVRLAARQINADKVIFISHSEEAQSLADSRLIVAGGTVRVA